MICKICQEEVSDKKHFFRLHKIALSDYIAQYEVRKDLFSGEVIPFRGDYDKYLEQDFADKNNLKAYLKSKTKEEASEYCKKMFVDRKTRKNLVWSPTQVELRSLLSPSIVFLSEVWGDYYDVCEKLGYKKRFLSEPVSFQDDKIEKIFVDSREQNPVIFEKGIATEVVGLKYGDYAIEQTSPRLVIERKSLNDLCGTMSSRNLDRFHREIEKAAAVGSYVVVLVETTLSKSLSFNYLPHMKNVKASPEYIFNNIRETTQKYPNLQFLFVDGRKEMSRLILKLLSNQEIPAKIDLQLLYDLKKL